MESIIMKKVIVLPRARSLLKCKVITGRKEERRVRQQKCSDAMNYLSVSCVRSRKRCRGRGRMSCALVWTAWRCRWQRFIVRKLRGRPKCWRPPGPRSPSTACSYTTSERGRSWTDKMWPSASRTTAWWVVFDSPLSSCVRMA